MKFRLLRTGTLATQARIVSEKQACKILIKNWFYDVGVTAEALLPGIEVRKNKMEQ